MKRGLGHGVSSGGRGNGVLSHGDAAVEASGGVSLIKAVAISGVFDLSMLNAGPDGGSLLYKAQSSTHSFITLARHSIDRYLSCIPYRQARSLRYI